MSFVHLHVHTQYSLLDGANKIGPLIDHAKASGMEAIAMTDHGNMFGAVEFYQKAKAAGIKPIIGCEAYLAPGKRSDRTQVPRSDDFDGGGNFHLILLAQNRIGYRNLCKLLTTAYQDGLYYKPRIDKEVLAELSDGLIVLSGCLSGELARWLRQDRMDKARETAESYAKMFPGRYYLELQDNKLHSPYNEALREIGKQVGLPLVATNDCHYLHRDDAKAHEVLLCIQTGKTMADETRWRFDTDELYVKTPDEMANAFGAEAEELRNSVEIARRIDFEFEFGKFHFPVFKSGPGVDLDAEMEARAREGLTTRLVEIRARRAEFDESQYQERIDREIPVIRDMGFSGYMLIVADFIGYARGLGIPVGPGRGSVVGSLVSYALGITEVDPVEHRLLFERWLNPGRKSMPDIDVDFCFERRDEVLELRAQEVRRRSRRADNHVRHDQGQAGDSRRRARARTVVRRDRQNRQALSGAQAGPRFSAPRRARDGAAAQGRAQALIPIFSTTHSSSRACCVTLRGTRRASSFPISRSPTSCRCTSTRNATRRRCRSRNIR